MAIHIRPMTLADLEVAIGWAAAEGWNPGKHDAAPYFAADPEGFLMAFEDGAPVSCISAVRYGEAYGFLGMYIARPEARGKGYGMAVWEAAMAHFGSRTVGLDGVVAQQANYARSGFVAVHRNIRFSGPAPAAQPLLPAASTDQLLAFDKPFVPANRTVFLTAWLTNQEHVVRSIVRDGEVKGYGVLRPCLEGSKIGPLFADDEGTAEAIFLGLAAEARSGPFIIDVPETNHAAVRLAERHGLAPVFETARMYKGPAPQLPLNKIFGFTTLELG